MVRLETPLHSYSFLSPNVSMSSVPEECIKHKNLSEPDRNINYGKVTNKCDSKLSGWHRFVGPAGSHMLDNCPSGQKCNTDFQGWIDGQPKPGESRVSKKFCKQGNNKCCLWPKDILTTHCGDFIVYNLFRVNCYIRYCGENWFKRRLFEHPTQHRCIFAKPIKPRDNTEAPKKSRKYIKTKHQSSIDCNLI